MFTYGKPWWCWSRWPFFWDGQEPFPPMGKKAIKRAIAMLARALILSFLIIPLWMAVTPLYNRLAVFGLDLSLYVTEPENMSHLIKFESGRLTISRQIKDMQPMEFSFNVKMLTFNVVILLALILSSPLTFGKRWFFTIGLCMLAMYMFHVLVLYLTSLNPSLLTTRAPPSHVLPYLEQFGSRGSKLLGIITFSLHASGWALAPVIIWALAVRKKAF